MKIEFIRNSTNGPMIHLSDFSNDEVMEIKEMIDRLSAGEVQSVALHHHALVNPADNCHLTLKPGPENKGITYSRDESQFVCTLTKEHYENMSELIRSFAEHALEMEGFEWLDETSEIALLISPSKRW